MESLTREYVGGETRIFSAVTTLDIRPFSLMGHSLSMMHGRK